ncbi:hypothetical protein [Actinophytocola algeriensis]|uniref:Uncharacterized protein n=1 Tax=Actinophytocola algeriensis TaxID=1768010 RepID=A0A7W7Q2I0_9PSEU|nr:hypothetical protein [Actinophytocola algeriensis]MBB4905785.1 hypothetical protein [Actinophytocola algeriensis]MBE1472530.1 hypothetical protein [Actinophytocola algeriensis]
MEITVERVRHALVVGRLDADGAAVLLAANLPPKRDRTFVVVGASSVDAMRRLDPWVVADLADEVRGDLCVVAPGFGSMGADGTLPPARLLADRLGVEVTAADGDPVGLADGSVFVPGPAAGWVSYRPGGRRTRVGARFPAPWWQDGLPEEAEHLTHVPVGLWLRRPGSEVRPGDPLLRQVPDRDRMYVVLGAPGERPPAGETVAEVLRTLPDEARDRAVLAWYGAAGQAGELARAVADALGTPVRVAHGVPGDSGLVHVDEHGTARWRPFAVESVYRPGGAPPVLDRWVAPPRLPMAEPGSFRLVPGWRVDVVARGLVVRPETVRPDPAVLTALAAETGPTADIVFATDGPVPDGVLPALDRLVPELPADTRAALRILPADEAAAAALTGVEAADHVATAVTLLDGTAPGRDHAVPPVGRVVVTADGRIVPEAPILAVPAPRVVFTAPVAPLPAVPAPTAALDIRDGVLVVAEEVDEEERTFAAVAPEQDEEETEAPEFVATGDDATVHTTLDPVRVVDGFAPAVGPVLDATTVPDEPPRFAPSAAPAEEAVSVDEPVATGFTASAAPGVPDADREAAVVQPVVPGVVAPAVAGHTRDTTRETTVVVVGAGGDEEESHLADLANVAAAVSAGIPSVAAATAVPAVVPVAQPEQAAEPAARPVASVTGLLPGREFARPAGSGGPAAIEVPEHVRSTVAQRRAMRAKLGSRYDIATRAVTRLLSERPGLRFGAGDHAALLAELAVVRVFADDPAGDYDADFYVCLADGLRRLPTARAVVVRGIPAGTDLRPEFVIRLPTPLVAAPVTAPEPVGPAEALIWTTTARRLDGLLDDPPPAEPDDDREPAPKRGVDVVLSGHTRLRVLAVAPTPVRRVLLAEDGAAPEAALTRLLAAAAVREEAVATAATSKWFGALPEAG